ncbi:unnamed protein product [Sphagnum jensenii]|uniref:Uncharacterized protein n=1 Tax=Sphagnum jensenii TaxID=128206 RepID=A0ABP0WNG9_9BRYO
MSRCERQKRPASCAARVPASSARTYTFPSPPPPGNSTGMREGEQPSGQPPKVGPTGSGHPADKRGRRPD